MKRFFPIILMLMLILTLAIAGCGGGKRKGDNGGEPLPGSDLAAPQITKVTAADRQLTVEWSAVPGAASYLVWWGSSNDTGTAGKSSYETADTSYTITGLSNDITYYIFVQAKNSAGVSSPSSLASGAPIQSTTAPAVPGTPVLTPGDRELTVKWEAVTGATFYHVYCSTGGSPSGTPVQQNITATSCTITELDNGTAYNVWIKAGNAIGTSDFSNPANMAPGPPSSPAVPVLNLGNNCINALWTSVPGATGYEVHYSGNGSEILYTNFNTSGNSYTIQLPDYGTMTYAVWIIAKNNAGKSGNSPSASIQYVVSIGEIAGGTCTYPTDGRISFGSKTFTKVPEIVVNAYETASGKPLIAGVQSQDATGFNIKLASVQNYGFSGAVTVQWVAINPNPGVEVQAGHKFCQNGDTISFPYSNLFSSSPVVICSGYGTNGGGSPLMAAPYDISQTGFTVALRDAGGSKAEGNVSYIAIAHKDNVNYYQEAAIVSSNQKYSNNYSIQFNLFRNTDTVLCSALSGDSGEYMAYAVAGREISETEYKLGLLDCDGDAGTSDTYWIAFGFK